VVKFTNVESLALNNITVAEGIGSFIVSLSNPVMVNWAFAEKINRKNAKKERSFFVFIIKISFRLEEFGESIKYCLRLKNKYIFVTTVTVTAVTKILGYEVL